MSGRPNRQWALTSPSMDGVRQVVLTEDAWVGFVNLVYASGLHVFPIPVSDDDLPTYGIGVEP